ncbi:hypothetical protein FXO38_23969 [Capsicum annuum]|nr:hypothetical protein FXO38_23969 [Capsicum annuum]
MSICRNKTETNIPFTRKLVTVAVPKTGADRQGYSIDRPVLLSRVKRPTSTSSSSRKRKAEEVSKTFKRKKSVVDESVSKIESKILADISKYDESSAHKSEDFEDSEGRSKGKSKEESESGSGEGEDRRDTGDGEEDPLSLPICARDISIKSYGLTTWMDDLGSFPANIYVTKNKSITAAKLISLMKGKRLNNQQKLKYALVWFMHAILLAKDPSNKVDSDYIKMAIDIEFFGGYPWGKKSFGLTLSYLKQKTNLNKQKEAFVKRNNASFGYMSSFLIWEGTPISHWILLCLFSVFLDDTRRSIVHPYLTPTVREMEQRYMRTFKPYTEEVKNTSIDALKVQLKGVTVLTSSAEFVDEDEDLGGRHYVPSLACACDHTGSSGLKTALNASNDDDLCKRVALLEKMHLDSPPRSRDKVNLKELAITVTDIAAVDEKVEEEKKEEETK